MAKRNAAEDAFVQRFKINGEQLLTLKEMAEATGLHRLDLEDAANAGVVPSIKLGMSRYFLLSAFTEALEAQVRGHNPGRKGGVDA